MSAMKRAHSQVISDDIEGNYGMAVKRPCPPTEFSGKSKQDAINQAYIDALTDISDEIRFAVKCIDRAAGDETSNPFFHFFQG
jgi:hypothetical protein